MDGKKGDVYHHVFSSSVAVQIAQLFNLFAKEMPPMTRPEEVHKLILSSICMLVSNMVCGSSMELKEREDFAKGFLLSQAGFIKANIDYIVKELVIKPADFVNNTRQR